jgi:glutathione S-transferase
MLKLVIGNKNYSSWSLRAWLLLTEARIPFEEVRVTLFSKTFAREIGRFTPAGRVPVLIDPDGAEGGLAVWDTLAIAEYVAERFPDHALWPRDPAVRARARSLTAEMHSGFGALRNACPMNVTASLPGRGWNVAVQRDVDRLVAMWSECLERHGGPLLFGDFTIADAFFAPVLSRFVTYAIEVPDTVGAYRDRVLALDGMRAWTAAAADEADFLVEDEPYRLPPADAGSSSGR